MSGGPEEWHQRQNPGHTVLTWVGNDPRSTTGHLPLSTIRADIIDRIAELEARAVTELDELAEAFRVEREAVKQRIAVDNKRARTRSDLAEEHARLLRLFPLPPE